MRKQLTGETTGNRAVVDYVDNLKQKLKFAREQANQNEAKAKTASKIY